MTSTDTLPVRARDRLWFVVAFVLYVAAGVTMLERAFVRGEALSAAGPYVRSGPFSKDIRTVAPIGVMSLQDSALQYEPWMFFAATQLAEHGRIPLWKDSTLCGAPFFANHQAALLWPLHLVVFAVGLGPSSEAWMALAQFVLGALGAYALVRHLGFGVLGALVGGAAFGFSGFPITEVFHPHTHVSCILPWLALAADRCVIAPSARRVALVAILAMVQHFAGHAETAFHAQGAVGVFALARALDLTRGAPWSAKLLRLMPCAVGFVLGAGLACIQLLPFIEYLLESETWRFRHESGGLIRPFGAWHAVVLVGFAITFVAARRLAREGAKAIPWGIALGVGLLVSLRAGYAAGMKVDAALLLVPDLYGPATGFRGTEGAYLVNHGFLGGALLLAVIGAVIGTPSRVLRFSTWVFVTVTAIGLVAPWFTDVIQRLPLFSVTVNERLTFVAHLAAAVLCAAAVDRVGRCSARDVARATAATLAVVVAIAFGVDRTVGPNSKASAELVASVRNPTRVDSALVAAAREETSLPTDPLRDWELAGWIAAPSELKAVALQLGAVDAMTGWLVMVPPEARALDASLPQGSTPIAAARFQIPSWGIFVASDPVRIVGFLANGQTVASAWFDREGRETAPPRTDLLSRRAPRGERGYWQLWAALAVAACALIALCAPRTIALGCGAALLPLVLLPSWIYAYGFLPYVSRSMWWPKSPGTDVLRAFAPSGRMAAFEPHPLLAEQSAIFGYLEPTGYDALAPWRTEKLMHAAGDFPRQATPLVFLPTDPDADLRLLGVMAIRGLVHPDPAAPRARDWLGKTELYRMEHHFVVTQNDQFLPRARLVAGIEVEGDDDKAIARLKDKAFPLATRAIIAAGAPRADGDGDVGLARIVSTDPDHVFIEIDPKRDAMLVLADTYFPGWRARVDGKERRIERANVAFRAVAVKPGDKLIEFSYEPKSFKLGAAASACAGLVLAALLLWRRRR